MRVVLVQSVANLSGTNHQTRCTPQRGAEIATGAGPGVRRRDDEGNLRDRNVSERGAEDRRRTSSALIKRNFYNGQRILRIVPNQLVQFGDPQTRDMTKQAWWGRGFDAGSGKSDRRRGVQQEAAAQGRRRVDGASGRSRAKADSQMFIRCSAQPKWNGQYTVFGQVISGMDVVRKLAVTDRIVRVTLKPESPS